MADRRRDLVDAAYAFLIGSLVGIGAALLLRDDMDDETTRTLRRLQDEGVRARRPSRRLSRELRDAIECARRYLPRG